jgi:hypothetical protein
MGQIYGDTQYARPDELVFKRLIDIANSDSVDMAVDSSGAALTFRYTAPAGTTVLIERICVAILDTTAIPSTWGQATMTNGITFKVHDSADAVLVDFTDGAAITSTAQMALLAGDATMIDTASGVDQVAIRWELSRAGRPVMLQPAQYFAAVTNDDLSGLALFEIMVQGYTHVSP